MTNEPTASNPTARVSRILPATPEEVFDAWTDESVAAKWMCNPKGIVSEVTLDARPGGAYRLVMLVEGQEYAHTGTYREVLRPERLVFTWHSPSTRGRESLVRVALRPTEGGTELELTHELLPDDEIAEGHRKGWGELFDNLDRIFRSRG